MVGYRVTLGLVSRDKTLSGFGSTRFRRFDTDFYFYFYCVDITDAMGTLVPKISASKQQWFPVHPGGVHAIKKNNFKPASNFPNLGLLKFNIVLLTTLLYLNLEE